ncbi:uncharacterized protein TNCV_2386281 [Trichonephila clavipes]|nr:uncharacterized protein TNCV_2386281 [Trichonephila clavipes]
MPLDNKCRIGPLAGAPPDTCAVVIITETESGFITEDDTSPVCHTPSCPRSAKIQSTLPMMWGQWFNKVARQPKSHYSQHAAVDRAIEGKMHVKYVEDQRPHVAVVWKFGEWSASSSIIIVT